MKKLIVLTALLLVPFVANAGDSAAGQGKAAICSACHGVSGISIIPDYPNLAGQKESYIAISLKAFRAGERTGGNAALMTPMAANLSDADIDDLAAYYSGL